MKSCEAKFRLLTRLPRPHCGLLDNFATATRRKAQVGWFEVLHLFNFKMEQWCFIHIQIYKPESYQCDPSAQNSYVCNFPQFWLVWSLFAPPSGDCQAVRIQPGGIMKAWLVRPESLIRKSRFFKYHQLMILLIHKSRTRILLGSTCVARSFWVNQA